MSTIRKHSRRMKQVFREAKECRVYNLSNNFKGEPCSPDHALTTLLQLDYARLYDNGNNTFVVLVHDNKWYELK
jgi:hypothetical protein